MIDLKEIENTIIHADCMDILKELPDKCIDLVLTDPPYGIGASSKTFMRCGKQTGKSKCVSGLNYKPSSWDNKTPEKEVFNEIFRVSKNQIIFGGNYFVEYLKNSPCWIVWDKHNGDNLYADCELAYTSFNTAVRQYDFIWHGMIQQNMKNKEQRIHPTQKPVDLFGQIIRDYSKENDLILDCFSGSGTTAVACHNLNRRFICIEKDYDYWKASVDRLEEAKKQLKMF